MTIKYPGTPSNCHWEFQLQACLKLLKFSPSHDLSVTSLSSGQTVILKVVEL